MVRKLKDVWFKVEDDLPKEGKYVLVHYNGGNWKDEEDQFGCECLVARRVCGISVKEREAMLDCTRKRTYKCGDEWSNNEKPYEWCTFGETTLFGQDVDMWKHV